MGWNPSRPRRKASRSERCGRLPRHFILQHRRRRHDRGRSGRGLPHDGPASTAHGVARTRQRMGHQRPQLGSPFGTPPHCQGLPGHRSPVCGRHRLGSLPQRHGARHRHRPRNNAPSWCTPACRCWATTRVECAANSTATTWTKRPSATRCPSSKPSCWPRVWNRRSSTCSTRKLTRPCKKPLTPPRRLRSHSPRIFSPTVTRLQPLLKNRDNATILRVKRR